VSVNSLLTHYSLILSYYHDSYHTVQLIGLAYTVWNSMFIYSNYPYAFGRHSAVLLAPLALICHWGWDAWLQARCFTLGIYIMIRCTAYERLRSMTDVHLHQTKEQTRFLQVVSFACVAILLAINNLSSAMNKKSLRDGPQYLPIQSNMTYISWKEPA